MVYPHNCKQQRKQKYITDFNNELWAVAQIKEYCGYVYINHFYKIFDGKNISTYWIMTILCCIKNFINSVIRFKKIQPWWFYNFNSRNVCPIGICEESKSLNILFPLHPKSFIISISKSTSLHAHWHTHSHTWLIKNSTSGKEACYYAIYQHIKLTILLISTHEIRQSCIKTVYTEYSCHSEIN